MAETVGPQPPATVIVPTRKRPASLARCLDALDGHEGLARLDVVVDDGSVGAAATAENLRLSSFLRQQFGYGRGAYLFRRRHSGIGRFEPPRFYAALVQRGFAHSPRAGVLVGVAQAATAAGFAWEALSEQR